MRLLRRPKVKYGQAAIEGLNTRPGCGIDQAALIGLATTGWVPHGDTTLLTGRTGVGKTSMACAVAQHGCRAGHTSLCLRVPRMAEELRALHASGGFGKWLLQLARTEVLILDDWGIGAVDSGMRADLLEIIDDRAAHRATIVTHQLPIEHWHGWIGDAKIADAILDRLMQRVHRFDIEGESRRSGAGKKSSKAKSANAP